MNNNEYRDKQEDKNKQTNEINTTFPMEFPAKQVNPENHIVDVVVNQVFPPKSASISENNNQK